ncbi:MAG: hypothetical protein IKK43_04330 [Clostridia bacterium]|nr:hypothetical protein [Clostridia bacterium]
MKKKIIISFILICIIVALIAFFIHNQNNHSIDTKFVNYPTFTVTATSEHNNLIDIDTSFNLKASEGTTLELVQSCFSITPKVEYEINEISKDYYALTLKEELEADKIYNIEYKTDKAPYKWSFQTEKKFNVANFYPGNKEYVLPSTVIEIDFTYIPDDNIREFFAISPNVEGKFLFDERRIRFVPNGKLALATTYEVTILEGYGNKENDEKTTEQSFSFSTTISEKYGTMSNLKKIDFDADKYAFGENQDIYISHYNYYDDNITNYKIAIYQYKNSVDFVEDLMAKEVYGNYPELKPVDLTRLDKIDEKELLATDVVEYEYSWKKAVPIDANLSEGYYIVVITINGIDYYMPLQINNTIAVTQYFDDRLMVWVHDLKTQKPFANAKIKIDDIDMGVTNKEGYCVLTGIELPEDKDLLVQIYAENRTTIYDVITSHNYWSGATSEYDNTYIKFDRDTFKTGEILNTWGFIKDRRNIETKECTLTIKSSSEGAVFEERKITLDEFGTFKAAFDLTNYTSGSYFLSVYANGNQTSEKWFEIRDYETNSYDVSMSLDKKNVRAGEKITCSLNVKLFDGTPLENIRYNAKIEMGDKVTTKEITTDANGDASFEIDTSIYYTYNNIIYGYVRLTPIGIEDQNYLAKSFSVYPHEETFETNGKYIDKEKMYEFNIETYYNDYTNMDEVKKGALTNRTGKVMLTRYRKEKVVTSTYFDENTKTMKENYKIVKHFDGFEELEYTTVDGKATVRYASPYATRDEGVVEYTASFYSEKDWKNISDRWTYVSEEYDANENQVDFLMNNYYLDSDAEPYGCKVGQEINLKVVNVTDDKTPENVYVMYVLKSAKGTEIIYTDKAEYKLKFEKEFGADITIEGFVFDGTTIRALGDYYYDTQYRFSLADEELDMQVEVEFDKEHYKPGDTAKLKIVTKVDDNPVKAAVNLSAVNKEYLAANPQYNGDILYALHNYYNFYIKAESFTHTILSSSFEGGGGGGGDGVRIDFATTALFDTVYTDENGVAEYEVKLPDNITTWNLNVEATTKDYRATSIDKDIVVTLPFFSTAVMNEKYLVGETPSVSIRSNGTDVKTGDKVTYDVTITDTNNKITKFTKESEIGKYLNISLGKLERGEYTLLVKASCNGLTDAFERTIEAVNTLQETTNTTPCDLIKGEKISVDKGSGVVYLYNADIEKIFDDLVKLSMLPRVRNDQKVISYMTDNLWRKLQNIDAPADKPYINTYNGIELIEDFSNKDSLLTAKIVSTGYFAESKSQDIIKYFKNIIKNDDIDIREKLYAYWGLAALKEPVLNDIKLLDSEFAYMDSYEKAIVGLAYADIGDYVSANKIFDELILLADQASNETYEYITMLAFKLNRQERENLYDKYLSLNRESEYSNFVKLFRIQNEVQNNVEDAYVNLEVNGEEKKIDIKGINIESFAFTYKDEIKIKDKSDNLLSRFRRTEEITSKNAPKINAISKTYIVNGKESNTFKMGDMVTVTIKLDYNELAKENIPYLYTVEDVMPNCFKYSYEEDYDYEHLKVDSPYKKDGQKLYFYVHKCNEGEQYISYTAIATAKGEFVSDGVILKNTENKVIDYHKIDNIIVE